MRWPASFAPPTPRARIFPTVQTLRFTGHVIEVKTSGRLHIRVFHSRQLGEAKETIEQTRAGAIDLNRTNVALIGTFVPAMRVLAMQRWPIFTSRPGDPAAALIARIRKVD